MSFIKFIQFLAVQHISGPINSIVYSFSQSCTTSNSQMFLLLCWIVALRIVHLHSTVSPSTRLSRARRMWRVDVELENRVFREFYCNAWSSILHMSSHVQSSCLCICIVILENHAQWNWHSLNDGHVPRSLALRCNSDMLRILMVS